MQDQDIIASQPMVGRFAQDLLGQRFGHLVVSKRSGNTSSGNSRWTCACDCGSSVVCSAVSLRNGRANRCRRCASTIMVGSKFGKLTVAAISRRARSGRYVDCQCDCGATITVKAHLVKEGSIVQCRYCGVVDLRGRRFGSLVVVDLAPIPKDRPHKAAYWLCQCDCGGTKVTRTDYLRTGRCASCGCKKIGRKSRTPFSAVWTQIIAKCKWQATIRNIPYELLDAHVVELSRGLCHYCGAAPSQLKRSRLETARYNGIDRLDSGGGYVSGNVVTCCKHCNLAKNTMSYQEFRSWVKRIYKHFVLRPQVAESSQDGSQLTLSASA